MEFFQCMFLLFCSVETMIKKQLCFECSTIDGVFNHLGVT